MPVGIKHALIETYEDVPRNHTLQMAAALSYYSVVSFFPTLVPFVGDRGLPTRARSFQPSVERDGTTAAAGQHGTGPESFVGCNRSQQRNVLCSGSVGNSLDVVWRILGCYGSVEYSVWGTRRSAFLENKALGAGHEPTSSLQKKRRTRNYEAALLYSRPLTCGCEMRSNPFELSLTTTARRLILGRLGWPQRIDGPDCTISHLNHMH
jgi:hypothetical protein